MSHETVGREVLPYSSSPGLSFYLPQTPRPHTVLHIPESHTLYVGPLSCTRRHDIHARQYGDRDDVSFLFIDQEDVISGRYEDLMVQSIGQLLDVLESSPRIIFLAVFCIDDFLGTDEDALVERLTERYPECQFAIEHIDPVSINERQSMGAKKLVGQYRFIKPVPTEEHDRGINLMGVFVPFNQKCEMFQLLEAWGVGPLRALYDCKTYEDYQAMGKSCLNLVFRTMQTGVADYLEDHLEIPYYVFAPSYDARAVAMGYKNIAQMLGCEADAGYLDAQISSCEKDAQDTVRLLDGMPVAIDCEFSLMTFAATKALISYGFNVRHIFRSNHSFKLDAEAEEYVFSCCPQVRVERVARDFSAATASASSEPGGKAEILALGVDCARILNARYVVDIWHDEGYFGFEGIHDLMALIRETIRQDKRGVES